MKGDFPGMVGGFGHPQDHAANRFTDALLAK